MQDLAVNFAADIELRRVIDAIPVQIWCTSRDGVDEFQNTTMLDYVGLSAQAGRADNWRDAIHQDDAQRYRTTWSDIMASRAHGRIEVRLRRFDGTYRRFSMHINPVQDQSGDITRWYGTNIDIDTDHPGPSRPTAENARGRFAEAPIADAYEGLDSRFIRASRADISERKRSEEALRASEQLARGQVEALEHALDALAMDSSPDRPAQHISRTITGQLGAHSCSVWRRNEANGLIGFEFAFEQGHFVTKSDSIVAGLSLWLPMDDSWPWPAVMHAGRHCLIEDIGTVASFPLRDRLIAIGIKTVLMIPMLIAGRLEGAIAIRFMHRRVFRAGEIEFVQTMANQAVLAMQLARLSVESRDAAVLAERNRMARDIHDTLAQGFTGVIVQLGAAEDARLRGLSKEADQHLVHAGDLAREGLKEARRSVQALRPQALEDDDLCDALDGLLVKMTAGTRLRSEFKLLGDPRPLPLEWEEHLLHIGREVLTNVLRHAQASRFSTQLTFAPGAVHLDLRDDGCGFDPSARKDGFGLLGMRERVERIGGQMKIQSAPDQGTAVLITVPTASQSLVHQ